MQVKKIKAGGVNVQLENFIGEHGTLFYDSTYGNLRLSDGHTPGGISVAGLGGGSIVQQDTAPLASTSTIWYDTISGRTYVYFDGSWIDASPASNSTTTVDLSAVAQDIIPAINAQYNLGSEIYQWKSLYVSTNTIYIGNVPLTIDTLTNILLVNGSRVTSGSASTSTLVNNNLTVSLDTSGTLHTPLLIPKSFTAVLVPVYGFAPGYNPPGPTGGDAWSYEVHFVVSQYGTVETQIDSPVWASNPGYKNGDSWTFHEADHGIPGYTFTLALSDITYPGPAGWTANVLASQSPDYPSTVKSAGAIKLTADTSNWTLGTDGNLTLPTDGSIDTYSGTGGFKITTDGQIQFASGYSIGGSDTGLGLRMATDRGTILFGNHPEPGTTTHFHIMKQDPSAVDLFFGDDFNYVKLKGNENIPPSMPYGVEIGTNDYFGSQNTWRFGTDGNLTLPNSTVIGTLSTGTSGIVAPIDTTFVVETNKSSVTTATSIINPGTGATPSNSTGTAGVRYVLGGPGGAGVGMQVRFTSGGYAGGQILNPTDIEIIDPGTGYQTGDQLTILNGNNDCSFTIQVTPQFNNTWTFGTDGNLTAPGDVSAYSLILNNGEYQNSINLVGADTFVFGGHTRLVSNDIHTSLSPGSTTAYIQLSVLNEGNAETNDWLFNKDGTLTLPGGNSVSDSMSGGIALAIPKPPITITISGADFSAVNLTYIRDPNQTTPTWGASFYDISSDPHIVFDTGVWGIVVPGFNQALYVNTGSINSPLTQWNTNPPLGTIAPTGVYTYASAWTFGADLTLTVPGDIRGQAMLGLSGDFEGHVVNIAPAAEASNKKFKFRIDQLGGQQFTRAFLDMPTAENDHIVAIDFPHTNGTSGFIFNQGDDTNGQGMNNAFNILFNSGDIKLTAEGTDGLKTWRFGNDGGLTFPNSGGVQTQAWNDTNFMAALASYDGAVAFNTATVGTGGLTVNGPVQFNGSFTFQGTATVINSNSGTFYGDVNGVGALYAGVAGSTPLPATVIQSAADINDYIQNNFQNLNHGTQASTEWVATNDLGDDSNNYIDIGIAGHGWDGTQANSVGTAAGPSDSWVYTQGTVSSSEGGNLILGTIKDGKAVKILAGSNGAGSLVAQFNASGLALTTGTGITFPDGTRQTSAVSSSGTVVLETLNVSNISATNITINGQSITAGVTRITAGTGTHVSTTTGALTLWTDTFNTSTLVAQAVTALSIPYSNVTGTPNLSGYATQSAVSTLQISVNNLTNTLSTLTTTATVNSLIANSLTNYATQTYVNSQGFITSSALSPYTPTSGLGTIIANSLTNYATQTYVTTRGYLTTVTSVAQATSASIVTTAAQPNITSVGTLTSLSVSGNVTANKFVGDGSSLSNVTVNIAGNIIGTGTNVSLVAGSYTYTFDNTGTFTMPVNGNIVMPGANTNLTVGGNLTVTGNITSTPVGFRATTPVTNVSVNNGSTVTMLFGTEEVDTNSAYNPATGRFTPNAAGYYSIDWFIVTSANGAGELIASLYKNGVLVAWGTNQTTATAHWNGIGGSAGMIYLNGTTDYISISLTNNSGSTATILAASGLSYFSAYLIR